MGGFIDLTPGDRTFDVTTAVTHGDGQAYMGPTVRVQARDAGHAVEVAKAAGHESNRYFPPTEVKPDRFRPIQR